MTLIHDSIQIIQYRMGKMPDTVLADISIAPRTRDIFCQTSFDFQENRNVNLGIASHRRHNRDLVTPTLHYSPLIAEHASPNTILKAVAHEGGHYMNLVQKDIFHPLMLSYTASNVGFCSGCLLLPLQILNNVITPKHKMSRRNFFSKATSVAGNVLAASYAGTMASSYYEESNADFIADAVVPERTMGQALQEMNEVFSTYRNSPDAPSLTDNPLPLENIGLIIPAILSIHPSDDVRTQKSIKNCDRFAKHTKLWSPQ